MKTRQTEERKRRRATLLSQNSSQQQNATTSKNAYGDLGEVDLSECDSELSYTTRSSKRSKLSATNVKSNAYKKPNISKPPPLSIAGEAYLGVKMKIDKILNFEKGLYDIKLIPTGVQIYPKTTEIFTKIKQHLIDRNCRFYTHDLREEQMAKFVLHGYLPTSESDLITRLKEVNITPVKVKTLTIKNKKFNDHAVYLIYFMKSQKIRISQLREVKILDYLRIKWEYYTNRHKGPIQCSNCQLFGHGGKNCHLLPRCIRCSDYHKSINCPKLIDTSTMKTRTRIPDEELMCSNCGQNHAANYSKCEKRIEFAERKKQFRSKNQRNVTNQFKPAPELNDFTFPFLHPNKASPRNQATTMMNSQQNDLFTTSELMQIFTELMTKMQSASTKLQQIQVLGEIVIKYATR